jgi:NTE family protein
MTTEEWLSLFERNEIGVTAAGNDRTVFGLIKGDVFEDYLRKALKKKGCKTIGDTKKVNHIAFACTATNIVKKNDIAEVVLKQDDIDMARAIRASMTYPAPLVGYKPVSINGMRLVDGGMLNNLPVDVVKELGAEKVIAIDLERGQKNERNLSLGNGLGLGWLVSWMIDHPDRNKRNRNLAIADVKIRPDLLGYSILSFNEMKIRDMILLGEDEAKTYHWSELIKMKK